MDKKAKKKKEREQKKKLSRRAASRSPFEKLDASPQDLRCVINADWESAHLVELLVRRDLPGDILAIAEFRISLDVEGLSYASGGMDHTEGDWASFTTAENKVKMIPLDPAEAQKLIAAGARIAQDHGLRLPDRWDKWFRVFGQPIPSHSLATADLSKFEMGYYGTIADLERRLIGSDVDTFLDRKDIDIYPIDWADKDEEQAGADHPEIVLDEDDDADSLRASFARDFAEMGETPHPDFLEAARINLLAGIAAARELANDVNLLPREAVDYVASVEQQILALPAERRAPIREALDQYYRYTAFVTRNLTPSADGEKQQRMEN